MTSKKVAKEESDTEGTCGKKALRSCARCRKNKIRCDSMLTRPNACTNCSRKGLECRVDYVTPPQRSKEMKYLCESIRFAEGKIDELVKVYDGVLARGGVSDKRRPSLCCPTRVLKVGNQFLIFYLDEEGDNFCVNNLRIEGRQLRSSLANFQKLLQSLLALYFEWDGVDDCTKEKAGSFVENITARGLLERNELLLLLCVVNFYFDIPNINYLDIFQYVIDSYCQNASCEESVKFTGFSKEELAKLIIGDANMSGQFHSESFIKSFTTYLFTHIVLYGPEYFMGCFMDKFIGTLEVLRKKINFDKNWEVKWVNFYIRLLNLIEGNFNVEDGKFLVEQEEVEEVFQSIEKYGEKISSLDCFISLIKFDQYIIQREGLPDRKLMEGVLLFICKRLKNDFESLFICDEDLSAGERLSFIHIFLHQLVSLNVLLCVNHCGLDLVEVSSFNGFNHDISEATFSTAGFYKVQKMVDNLKRAVSPGGHVKVPDYVLGLIDLKVQKHSSEVDVNCSLVKVIERDLKYYGRGDNTSLNILKSSCSLIWNLYEKVIYWDMFDKIYVHKDFIWDASLLLKSNGLECQGRDKRCDSGKVLKKVLRKIEDISPYSVEPRRCNSDSGYYTTGSAPIIIKEEMNYEGVGVMGLDRSTFMNCSAPGQESGDHIRGGISRILQDVDWVKESADDVLRKIHGVLN